MRYVLARQLVPISTMALKFHYACVLVPDSHVLQIALEKGSHSQCKREREMAFFKAFFHTVAFAFGGAIVLKQCGKHH